MKNVVSAKYLYENMSKVVIVDATNNFMIPKEGREKYEKSHIEGAFHIDLKNDMCSEVENHGGRDPLPKDMSLFKEKLENMGISTDSEIIVYDENMVPASRFWWMCRYIGVENVKLLDGGINSWLEEAYPVTATITKWPRKGLISMKINNNIIADIDTVRESIKNEKSVILDSRSKNRYLGLEEVIDKKAGHIPGALNYFYEDVLKEDGKYKNFEFLKEHFKGLENYTEIICQCGSGVSAPVNIIALEEIGISSKLYVGSWSDYITYKDSVIVNGK